MATEKIDKVVVATIDVQQTPSFKGFSGIALES